MFFRTDEPHGLPHNPFNALVVPRPIGWISSIDRDGHVNLAPYSFFNAVAYFPPQVVFASTSAHTDGGGDKDSVKNVEETGEFVCNLVTRDLAAKMNLTSAPAPRHTDEFEVAGLTKAPSRLVKPPRVAESPAHLECELVTIVELATTDPVGAPNRLVVGKVVAIHIDDAVLVDGRVDIERLRPLSRLGYMDYAPVEGVFEMNRPDWPIPG